MMKDLFCLLCYKPIPNAYDEERRVENVVENPTSSISMKSFDRFLKYISSSQKSTCDFSGSTEYSALCDSCKSFVEKYCDLYFELECIHMKLHWQLENIKWTMKLAEKVPSRVEQFKKSFNENGSSDRMDKLIEFRRSIYKICLRKTRRKNPYVRLVDFPKHEPHSRTEFTNNDTPNSHKAFENNNDQNMKMETCLIVPTDEREEVANNIQINLAKEGTMFSFAGVTSDESQTNVDSEAEDTSGSIPESNQNENRHELVQLEEDSESMYVDIETISSCEDPQSPDPSNFNNSSSPNTHDKNHGANCSDREPITPVSPPTDEITDEGPPSKMLRTILKCTTCSRTFSTSDKLNEHKGNGACMESYNDDENEQDEQTSENIQLLMRSYNAKNDAEYIEAENQSSSSDSFESYTSESSHDESALVHCSVENCDKAFNSNSELELHLKLHGDFSCQFCDFKTGMADILMDHEWSSHSLKQEENSTVQCSRCCMSFSIKNFSKKTRLQHFCRKHLNISYEEIKCPICGLGLRGFPTYEATRSLKLHINMLHNTDNKDPDKIYLCDICKAPFTSKSGICHHKTKVHKLSSRATERRRRVRRATHRIRSLRKRSNSVIHKSEMVSAKEETELLKSRPPRNARKNKRIKNYTSESDTENEDMKSKKKYPCTIENCGQSFVHQHLLDRHLKLHGQFYCDFCDFKTDMADRLFNHELKKHPPNSGVQKDKVKCSRCRTFFEKNNVRSLTRGLYHFLEKHLGIVRERSEKSCPICGMKFMANGVDPIERRIKIHIEKQHNTNGRDPNFKISNCDICNAPFRSDYSVMKHKILVHNVRELKCSICDQTFTGNVLLTDHLRKFHKTVPSDMSSFKCTLHDCGRTFFSKYSLECHIWKHEEKKSTCKICGKKLMNSQVFRQHMQMHENSKATKKKSLKSVVCDLCGKVFSRKKLSDAKAQLKIHLASKTHSEDRGDLVEMWKFACEICGKLNLSPFKLEEHIRTHTKEKPFLCNVCGREFSIKFNFKRHMRLVHKQAMSKGTGNREDDEGASDEWDHEGGEQEEAVK